MVYWCLRDCLGFEFYSGLRDYLGLRVYSDLGLEVQSLGFTATSASCQT